MSAELQVDLELACEWLGLWKPNQICEAHYWEWDSDGIARCADCRWSTGQYLIGNPMPVHNVAVPPLDDALAMRMLRSLATVKGVWADLMNDMNDRALWRCDLDTREHHAAAKSREPNEAIVRAVAALARKEKPHD